MLSAFCLLLLLLIVYRSFLFACLYSRKILAISCPRRYSNLSLLETLHLSFITSFFSSLVSSLATSLGSALREPNAEIKPRFNDAERNSIDYRRNQL
ncbi:hypothetical protein IQ07DRAFT_271690 [Pyrenochaeta sp. DS3sAY3a]|nr:hypothetical protein IQ07DRAFT_271690 [Pyrenochaeta sp. DS3sAY3a]